MKVVLYARVSSEKQAEKDLSIPAQLKALKEFALKKNWSVSKEFIDEAESARSADRPQFQEMISLAKQKPPPFQAILVWKFSRFARNRQDSVMYKGLLRKYGVTVISINEQVDDSPSGLFMEAILEAVDEFYSVNLAHDTLRGMKENASRGFLNGGMAPFGYKREKTMVNGFQKARLATEETEAFVVRRVFKMCLEGMGTKDIAKALNDEGVKTRSGKTWGKTQVHYLLTNETYTGCLIFNRYKKHNHPRVKNGQEKLIRADNTHPPLVSKEEFQSAIALMKARAPNVNEAKAMASAYLLSGLLHCGKCRGRMVGVSAKSGQFFYYACNNTLKKGKKVCSAGMVNQGTLENAVISNIRLRVLTEENITQLVKMVNEEIVSGKDGIEVSVKEKEAQITLAKQRLQRLYAAIETGKVDLDDLAPRIRDLTGQVKELEAEKEHLHDRIRQGSYSASKSQIQAHVRDLQNLLMNSSLTQSKTFLRAWIKRIDLDRPQGGTMEYAIPLIPSQDAPHLEVLHTVQKCSPGWTRTSNPSINSRMLHH